VDPLSLKFQHLHLTLIRTTSIPLQQVINQRSTWFRLGLTPPLVLALVAPLRMFWLMFPRSLLKLRMMRV